MDRMRSFVNLEGGAGSRTLPGEDQSNVLPELGRKQRLMAFAGCLAAGLAISIVGSILFAFGQVASFAVLYVVGICVSLTGTGFLVGFGTQAKKMLDPVRLSATLLMLGSVALTFVAAFVWGIDALVIIFAVASYVFFLWYALSYIPFARDLVKNIASKFRG